MVETDNAPSVTPLLEMRDIVKEFPGVRALKGVSFSVNPGEVHALVGENGAGKSTLIKIMAGVYRANQGEQLWKGQSVTIRDPRHAQEMGISVIYQEFNLVPYLTAQENIFLGRIPRTRWGLIDRRAMEKKTRDLLGILDVEIDLRQPVKRFSVAQQQAVEIAKALSMQAELIVMDEPTATLTRREIEKLFAAINRLKAQGVAVVYISHHLEEIDQIADCVTVVRDGEYVGTLAARSLDVEEIIRMMVGRPLDQKFPRIKVDPGAEVMRAEGLTRDGYFQDISFEVRKGEIVGISGLVGSKRTELVRAIFGADPLDRGQIYMESLPVQIRSPYDAVKLGIGLLPEERKTGGLVLILSVQDNLSLVTLEKYTRMGVVQRSQERQVGQNLVRRLNIRTPHLQQLAKNLSGGNQQKVVLAKWFSHNCRLLIFDEPTRGIDVGAKIEIYELMNELKRAGVGIVMISSELPEVLGMSDRILVMRAGRLVSQFDAQEATQEKIMIAALGGAS